MAVGYRSIFSLRRGQDAVRLTAEQLRSRLALKGYGFVAVAPGVHEVAERAQLVVTELRPHDGSRLLRYRLTESSSAGEWVTTVTLHSDAMEDDDNWVWVDVNAPPSAPRPAASPERLVREVDAADAWWTGVPHMVREILSVADACDGEMVLAARPTLVTVGDVDDLISAICDPGRRGTALVAAPIPDVPVPRLIGHVEQLTRECVGLAGIYVLDDFDPLGTWAARAWDMLRVLDGYAAARRRGEFSKGVHAYLGHTPPGRPGYAPGAHSTQESDSVERSPRLRKLRVFPVPRDVRPDGAIFKGAHFKIARKGLVSPRMHYHDDAGQAGKIYVGYIGRHLPNAHTN